MCYLCQFAISLCISRPHLGDPSSFTVFPFHLAFCFPSNFYRELSLLQRARVERKNWKKKGGGGGKDCGIHRVDRRSISKDCMEAYQISLTYANTPGR